MAHQLVEVKAAPNKGGNRTYKVYAEEDKQQGGWFPLVTKIDPEHASEGGTDGCIYTNLAGNAPNAKTEAQAIANGVKSVRDKCWN